MEETMRISIPRPAILALAAAAAVLPASGRAQIPPADPVLHGLFEAPAGKAHRASSASIDPASNLDFVPLASGAEIPIADLKGPGVITHMWINVQSDDPYAGSLVVLRAKWDGETTPSIEVPIGDFFGVGFSLDGAVDTLPVRVTADGRARNCSAYVTIRNDSTRPVRMLQWAVDWTSCAVPAGCRTFHAWYAATGRGVGETIHKALELKGRGHYVGTVLSIWSGEEGWPGEGDDRFFVDGDELPTLAGTGLEEYFGDNWSFHPGTGPYGGVTYFEGNYAGARTSACRWHLVDPIPFEKSLTVQFERSGWIHKDDEWRLTNARRDAITSVAFWYQEEPHGSRPSLPPPNERIPFSETRYEPEENEVFKHLRVAEGAPAPTRQEGVFWAYGGQVSFAPPDREHGHLFMPFDVPTVHDFDFYLRCTLTTDGGCWQALIDGEPVGRPIDLFAPMDATRDFLLGRVRMKPGGHELELRAVGRNVSSNGFALGFDSFMVRWYP
jgi:hypothetical protein